jgi:hypothetical protein
VFTAKIAKRAKLSQRAFIPFFYLPESRSFSFTAAAQRSRRFRSAGSFSVFPPFPQRLRLRD